MADELSQLETQLLAKLAPLAAQPIIAQPFAGLHDITLTGTQSPQGNPVEIVLTVVTGGATSPNTYTVTTDGGTPSAPVNMATTAVSIGNGFSVAFAAITGHTAGDTCIIQNGPLRAVRAWLFDGSEAAFQELIQAYGAIMPIGVLASPTTTEDPFDTKGNAGATISYTAQYAFLTMCTDATGSTVLSGDPNLARRAFYYDVKRRFDVALDDQPLTPITDPIFTFDQIQKQTDGFQLASDATGVITRHTIGVKCRGACVNVIN